MFKILCVFRLRLTVRASWWIVSVLSSYVLGFPPEDENWLLWSAIFFTYNIENELMNVYYNFHFQSNIHCHYELE